MARRIRSGAVDGGRYRHPGVYARLLRESCHDHVFVSGLGLSEPDPVRRVCPDLRLQLDPKSAHLFEAGSRWVDELFAERLAAGEPITARWVYVVRSSAPGANDGIMNTVADPAPHRMFENRRGQFRVFPDDTIEPADDLGAACVLR